MKRLIFFIFCLTSISLFSSEGPVLKLNLKSEGHLLSIYPNITHKEKDPYLKEIEALLRFNFTHNGATNLVELEHFKISNKPAIERWSELKVPYVFDISFDNPYMTFCLVSTKSGKVEFAEELKLSGDLDIDRKAIHELSNRVHKHLFKADGVYLSKILFTKRVKKTKSNDDIEWFSEIYQCDFDGGNAKQLTYEGNYCASPYFHHFKRGHDKDLFFYVSYKLGEPKVFYQSIKGSEPKRLTKLPGNQLMPEISKKGDLVAFISDAPGNPEVFVQKFDPKTGPVGKPKQVFSCRRAVQATPTFSPDGKKLAFVSSKSGSPKIYVMELNQEVLSSKDLKVDLISQVHRENTKPSWSPDGKKIAFVSKIDGVRQICIYDFTTQKEYQLTSGSLDKENPHWAFNSLHLVFNTVSKKDGQTDLYLVNLNQPKAVKIVPCSGSNVFPVWAQISN